MAPVSLADVRSELEAEKRERGKSKQGGSEKSHQGENQIVPDLPLGGLGGCRENGVSSAGAKRSTGSTIGCQWLISGWGSRRRGPDGYENRCQRPLMRSLPR